MTQPQERIKTGWQGRFFEDFQIGNIYRNPRGRTGTRATEPGYDYLMQGYAGWISESPESASGV